MLDEQTTSEVPTQEPTGPAEDSTAAPAPPPRKRAPRKTTKKAAAPPSESGEQQPPAGEPPAPADADPVAAHGTTQAAKRPARKTAAARRPRKTAAKEEAPSASLDTGAAAAPNAEGIAPDASAAESPAESPAGSPAESPAAAPAAAPAADAAAASSEQPPAPATMLLFQPPEPVAPARRTRRSTKKVAAPARAAGSSDGPEGSESPESTDSRAAEDKISSEPKHGEDAKQRPDTPPEGATDADEATGDQDDHGDDGDHATDSDDSEGASRRRRRRGGRRRRKGGGDDSDDSTGESGDGKADSDAAEEPPEDSDASGEEDSDGDESAATDGSAEGGSSRRRRRRRRSGEGDGDAGDDDGGTAKARKSRSAEDEITGFSGSTRLEAKKQRRREGREAGRRRAPIISEAEFLARRESVDRAMVIRQRGDLTQIAVLEDKVLVEHYVARESQTSFIGNVYLGRVQNVLPSMEAAFIDIGKGRNAVLYAGEVNWDALGAKGGDQRKIEQVLKPGQSVLVQVTKDPMGHKGARLTSQISLPGRFLVYVPGGNASGISRKLPDNERNRLKTLLKDIVPESAGVIVRTAAEGASEQELTRDVERLKALWEDISAKVAKGSAPQLLYAEPDLTLKVVRDLFTEDIGKLVVSGEEAWDMVHSYVSHVAPDLVDRLERHDDSERDAFSEYRIDEQIAKALDRKVWLPSGGSLVIDRTEAMTVVDVNTGKFTGSGGNLEETVTKNNLEAAEEIVRQLRLRDIGGIIVIDFIDMVLENNRDLVLRRLIECLGRDRTRHQVAEVTSLGLVQMTRKRIGTGLLEAFSEQCEHCQGRGVHLHEEPVEPRRKNGDDEPRRGRRGRTRGRDEPATDAKSDRRDSGRESGDAGDSGGNGSGRVPTPAEFAAMARAELAESEGKASAVEPETAPAAEPEAKAPTVEPETAPVAEPVAEPVAATAPSEPTPVESTPAEPAPAEPAPAAAPRIVTSVRRVGARRAAGPPRPTSPDHHDGTPQHGSDGARGGTGGNEPATHPIGELEEDHAQLHVPVKKKGARKH